MEDQQAHLKSTLKRGSNEIDTPNRVATLPLTLPVQPLKMMGQPAVGSYAASLQNIAQSTFAGAFPMQLPDGHSFSDMSGTCSGASATSALSANLPARSMTEIEQISNNTGWAQVGIATAEGGPADGATDSDLLEVAELLGMIEGETGWTRLVGMPDFDSSLAKCHSANGLEQKKRKRVRVNLGAYDNSTSSYDNSRRCQRRTGTVSGWAHFCCSLHHWCDNRQTDAVVECTKALFLGEKHGDQWLKGWSHVILALCHYCLGSMEDSMKHGRGCAIVAEAEDSNELRAWAAVSVQSTCCEHSTHTTSQYVYVYVYVDIYVKPIQYSTIQYK
jgi:hypothetical protein